MVRSFTKSLMTVVPVLLLSGCLTVGVKPDFPAIPEELSKECSALKTLPNEAELSDLMKTVRENYTNYHKCSVQVEAWKEWYEEQKKIQEKATK